jgi:murein tripeptide amidase MpaA
MKLITLALLLLALSTAVPAQNPSHQAAGGDAEWRTPAELSSYRTTPRYNETMAYVRRVAAAAPRQVKVEVFGKTGEGRDLVDVVVSRDGVFDPQALHRAGRPIVLIQNAIHAGEMDGKDSCLALLRDMVITKSRAGLLERAVVVIIPIYNADGHERFGPYNRINQNGPAEMGWRVNATNLNLNRDYVKAKAPETRAWLKLWNRWLPDFFVDDHVTDGADYQYDVTYGLSTGAGNDPAIVDWQEKRVAPYLDRSVAAAGHVIGPLIFLNDDADPTKGIERFPSLPRFADGYMVLQNRPGMLVEMHMLKDYKTRVTGNYEILRALLEVINRDADRLVHLNREADAAVAAAGQRFDPNAKLPLRTTPSKETAPFLYHTFNYTREQSGVSGQVWIKYTPEPLDITIPRPVQLETTLTIAPPRAYIVPSQWTNIIDVLEAHGLHLARTTQPWNAEVDTYRCTDLKWNEQSFEGHHVMFSPQFAAQPFTGHCVPVHEKLSFPAGSVVVPMDQRAAKVAVEWLEPEAPDSAVAWGYFDAIFEQKEFGEDYVLEKLAREMMAKDSKLRDEFEQRLAADKQFAGDAHARLDFFYRRSPWWDPELGLYPVGRLTTLEGVPLH